MISWNIQGMKMKYAICLLIMLSIACSSTRREGPAERAGKTIDRAIDRTSDATRHAYTKSKEWVKDTGNRISRGTSAFKEEYSRDDEEKDRDEYDYERERF